MDDNLKPTGETQVDYTSRMPASFGIQARGFSDEALANQLATTVGAYVRSLGKYFDMSGLDGVTVAVDYGQALLELDRGYETSHKLTASNSHVTGIAMTPAVIRDGKLKSHIMLDAKFMWPLASQDDAYLAYAIHVLAHECAHVQVTDAFDSCFPGVLLRKQFPMLENFQWQVIKAVWDEYAVTVLSARIGEDQTEAYEAVFINDLKDAEDRSNALIRQYRSHGSIDQVLGEIYGCWGNLLKFAAYHLGNLDGSGDSWRVHQPTAEALKDHWFLPYFERLHEACGKIADDFGRWTDLGDFSPISDIADELVKRAGLHITQVSQDQWYVDVPYTEETAPRSTLAP
ncbi:hypothetical protein [Pseudomonas amygdali]|uniref:Uncharacterized protein n=2 Tax=Pseudomonas amygdali pv. lachrymans TaxID=53707 RepID=A0ABR5KSU5_PSEAV|nr:hypothetical protein [Pseudomonas amygdali]AXH60198.1 hypothetical protein PLA107_033980 [Pseudomonas amygdali pv. lachrymans str. M301315]KPC17596.1 Uncharacterized protein AC499_0798 [Pseudomonas amygdali pv. lachrymans]RMT05689.1 hypothetical protein ALP54_04034 [Pseudomonas amygdali pv. lachrymans]